MCRRIIRFAVLVLCTWSLGTPAQAQRFWTEPLTERGVSLEVFLLNRDTREGPLTAFSTAYFLSGYWPLTTQWGLRAELPILHIATEDRPNPAYRSFSHTQLGNPLIEGVFTFRFLHASLGMRLPLQRNLHPEVTLLGQQVDQARADVFGYKDLVIPLTISAESPSLGHFSASITGTLAFSRFTGDPTYERPSIGGTAEITLPVWALHTILGGRVTYAHRYVEVSLGSYMERSNMLGDLLIKQGDATQHVSQPPTKWGWQAGLSVVGTLGNWRPGLFGYAPPGFDDTDFLPLIGLSLGYRF